MMTGAVMLRTSKRAMPGLTGNQAKLFWLSGPQGTGVPVPDIQHRTPIHTLHDGQLQRLDRYAWKRIRATTSTYAGG
eukprot:4667226-Prorocentrum_lima.AAC.1